MTKLFVNRGGIMEKQIKTSWRRLLKMLSLDKRDIKQICYYAVFIGIVSLSIPLGIQAIINLLQTGQVTSSWMVLVFVVTLGVAFQGGLQVMQIRILENIQQKIFTRTSFEFAYRFPKMKLEAFKNTHATEYANYFFDVVGIQKGLSKIVVDFPAALLQIIFGLLLLSFYNAFFIFYGLLFIIILYFLFKYSIEKGLKSSLEESNVKYKNAYWIQQVALGVKTFKNKPCEDFILNKNNRLTDAYLESRESHFKLLIFQFKKMIAFKVFITIGLLLIGGILVLNQKLNIGQFVASEIIILMIINSVEKLVTGLESFYDVLTSLEKIAYVVDKVLEEKGAGKLLPFKAKENKIEIRGIKTFENNKMLFEQGKTYIIHDNFGKKETVLFEILSGISSDKVASFLVNETTFSHLDHDTYLQDVGIVLAKEEPFKGSILENIALGKENVSREDVMVLLEKLHLKKFIQTLKNGIDTVIQPYGSNLPDTVVRKILLAREILRKPKVLLLEHVFSQMSKKESEEIISFLQQNKDWILIIATNHDFVSKEFSVINFNKEQFPEV